MMPDMSNNYQGEPVRKNWGSWNSPERVLKQWKGKVKASARSRRNNGGGLQPTETEAYLKWTLKNCEEDPEYKENVMDGIFKQDDIPWY